MLNGAPAGIIDIGSNSVRLVVYAGAERMPAPVFNEKVMAGLGTGVAETGRLSEERAERALQSLARFRLLLDHMKVKQARVVATAAVRDAQNGGEFVHSVDRLGFNTQILSGEEEARLAGEGVLSAIPGADGIVADLGGGSVELVEVREGRTIGGVSLPLGVLRIRAGSGGQREVERALDEAIEQHDFLAGGKGRAFYMVGGSWRALARIDMLATGYPLPIIHQYRMAPKRAKQLQRLAAERDPEWKTEIAAARLASAPVAAMLLASLVDRLEPASLVVSTSGIREGLLFSALSPEVRREDPLIEEVRCAGERESPFGEHGDLLDEWIGTIFGDPPATARIRLAACLLAEIAWQANPAFRADRGVEMALHGNWVGISAPERVMIAQALSSTFGRDKLADPAVGRLCTPAELGRARQWGLAMRLGQRLCGGVPSALRSTRLSVERNELRLSVRPGERALLGDPVKRRLGTLAQAMGIQPVFDVD